MAISYTDAYAAPNGPGDARPTASQIVVDNGAIGSWKGKVVLITGGTAGIGIETLRALHSTGADVLFTARDVSKALAVIEDVTSSATGEGSVEFIEMDLDSLESVRKAVDVLIRRSRRLDVLINNAGIMACPEGKTVDGFERQFGVNHLAHFTLIIKLLPLLLASATPVSPSRIVQVSSSSHRYSSIHWDNISLVGEYDPYVAYGQSKTAMIWTANYLDRHLKARGVRAISLHPGGIFTNLQSYAGEEQIVKWKADKDVVPFMMSPEQGAATTVWAATVQDVEHIGGKYLTNCSVAAASTNMTSALDAGVGPDAYNEAGEERLWKLSLEMTGLQDPLA